MEVLMTATYLVNPELNRSKYISFLSKLCLKLLYNVVSIGSLIMKKFDDYFLIIVHPKHFVNVFEYTRWENNYGIDGRVETDLTNLTFQGIYFPKLIFCETRNPENCVRGWCMYLWIRQYITTLYWYLLLTFSITNDYYWEYFILSL
jgi:hypothetical protein